MWGNSKDAKLAVLGLILVRLCFCTYSNRRAVTCGNGFSYHVYSFEKRHSFMVYCEAIVLFTERFWETKLGWHLILNNLGKHK